jgi:NADH dehydrogenase
MLACPEAKFQPVYVEDVARVLVHALDDRASFGNTYELCGPKVYTLRELVKFAGRTSGHPRPVIGLSAKYSMLQAWIMEWLPGKLMSRDNVLSMSQDSTSAAPFPFGIQPTAIEAMAPVYLQGTNACARFSLLRYHAGRKTREV